MSINTIANAAAARRPDVGAPTPPSSMDEIAGAAGQSPAAAGPQTPKAAPIDTTFNVLFGYIPTEIVTLYVAVSAALQKGKGISWADWITFDAFLVATPLVVWLVFGGKLKGAGKPLPLTWATWPVWEMTAATIAYVAWAFALPNSPFSQFGWYSGALSGVAVLLVSTALGLVAPFFQRQLGT
jgi:hypothetical protein